ncbi:MAG: sulfurtransferase [Clostridia bacterium]|jgi:thiosulfate/3-mercaptopyruvate sulfurtransferase|nr:sulfurtransferase [Clostridia bacterium]
MKKRIRLSLFVMIVAIALSLSGCGSSSAEGQEIIEASEAARLLQGENVVLVDMQSQEDYARSHVQGAVNIPLAEIVINKPVDNMLAPAEQIEAVLSEKGIGNDTAVIIYDNNNNMNAARLWWTLQVYGHPNAKVVSGGWSALQGIGLEITAEAPQVAAAAYTISAKKEESIADLEDIINQLNNPDKNVVILDTRSPEEYAEGRIPGAILMNYLDNNFSDGAYKPVQHIKIQYLENGIAPEKTIIMYCRTSVRASQTYLALYNAGYRNLKVYDGAWLEWTSYKELPVEMPAGSEVDIAPGPMDMS